MTKELTLREHLKKIGKSKSKKKLAALSQSRLKAASPESRAKAVRTRRKNAKLESK